MSVDALLPNLKARPSYSHLSDDVLRVILDESEQDFLSMTNRTSVPDRAGSVIVELACIKLNMMGAEGTSSASEGDVSRTWDAVPVSLKDKIAMFRLPLNFRRSLR